LIDKSNFSPKDNRSKLGQSRPRIQLMVASFTLQQ
jgi:hypothetical protein